jgi:hypothetical protein
VRESLGGVVLGNVGAVDRYGAPRPRRDLLIVESPREDGEREGEPQPPPRPAQVEVGGRVGFSPGVYVQALIHWGSSGLQYSQQTLVGSTRVRVEKTKSSSHRASERCCFCTGPCRTSSRPALKHRSRRATSADLGRLYAERGDRFASGGRRVLFRADTRPALDHERSRLSLEGRQGRGGLGPQPYLSTRHFPGWYMVNVLDLPSEDVAIALGLTKGVAGVGTSFSA